MADKTFKQLLDDRVIELDSFAVWRERWYDLTMSGEEVGELWEWLGFASEDEFLNVGFGYRNFHKPPKIARDIDVDTEKVAENLWYQANHFAEKDAAYVRNGSRVDPKKRVYRIVYGESDLEILKSYWRAVKYANKNAVPTFFKVVNAALKGEKYVDEEEDFLPSFLVDPKRSIADDVKVAAYGIWGDFHAAVSNDRNAPDGYFEGNGAIFHWEEDGEYYQQMQQTMGTLVAEFILADPTNPHAKKMAEELKRIDKAYGDRLKEIKAERKAYRKNHPYESNSLKHALAILKKEIFQKENSPRSRKK